MEGKEYREEEDDNQNSDSSDNNGSKDDQDSEDNSSSDDFGLPDVEDADSTYESDSVEDSFESTYESDSDDNPYSSESDYDRGNDDDQSRYYDTDQDLEDNVEYAAKPTNEQRDYYIHGLDNDNRGSGKTGWIIGIILFMLLASAGYWWFFMREVEQPKPIPKPKVQPVVVDTVKVVETPIIQDEKPISNTVPGQVAQLSTTTGRYYVVIASFIDVDLAMDYGNKLAKDGIGSTILSPKTGKGFYRFAIADFESLNNATLESERLKSTYGEDVWVIRY